MKKLIYILLGLCLLMVACSPEVVKKLPEQSLASESSDEIIITNSGSTIEIKFPMNSYAVRYGYLLNDSDIAELEDITQDLSYSDGWCRFEIQASGLPATGSITIYGQKGNDTQWTELITGEYVLSLTEIAPDAYFSRRDNNSAEIAISPITDFTSLLYRIEVCDTSGSSISEEEINGGIIELNNGKYSISLPDSNEYTLNVSQKLLDSNDSYSPTTKISIPTYDGIDSSIDIAANNNAFYISNIADDISSIELFKTENDSYDNISTSYGSFTVQNGTVTIPFEDKLKSLETGYFYVTNEDKTMRSNIINITAPLMIKNQTSTYKGLVLEFEPDENISNLELRVVGAAGAEAEINEAGDIFISGLDSNTEYSNLRLRVADSEYSVNPTSIETFKTKSFAGENGEMNYEWVEKSTSPQIINFRIVVKESESESAFPYYVYYSKDDAAIKGTDYESYDLRIMPLFDTAIQGETLPTEDAPIDYENNTSLQNLAYKANSEKWNSSGIDPISWYIGNADSDLNKDIVTTETISNAPVVGRTPTETTFSFMEYKDENGEYKPVIKFKNIITGPTSSLGNMFLNKNVANKTGAEGNLYGDTDANPEYCFYLTERTTN